MKEGISHRCFMILSTVITLYIIFAPLVSESSQGNYYALLIGNQNYVEKDSWKNLETPHKDIDALARILRKEFGFEVTVRKDLSRSQIIDEIEAYKHSLSAQDNLLIYFSGHGHLREDGGFWIGKNGKKKSRGDWLKYTTISDLIDSSAGMKAKHVLVLADSCYAGTAFKDIGDNDRSNPFEGESYREWIDRMVNTQVRKILTSGGEQPVLDKIGNKDNSIFAEELMKNLSWAFKNKKILLAQDLYRTMAPEVLHRSKRYIKDAMKPEYKNIPGTGDMGGDFVFIPTSINGPSQNQFVITQTISDQEFESLAFTKSLVRLPRPKIDFFTADRSDICLSGQAVLSWKTSNVDKCTLDGSPVNLEGKMQVNPSNDTSYRLECTGNWEAVDKTINISVINVKSEMENIIKNKVKISGTPPVDTPDVSPGDPVTKYILKGNILPRSIDIVNNFSELIYTYDVNCSLRVVNTGYDQTFDKSTKNNQVVADLNWDMDKGVVTLLNVKGRTAKASDPGDIAKTKMIAMLGPQLSIGIPSHLRCR